MGTCGVGGGIGVRSAAYALALAQWTPAWIMATERVGMALLRQSRIRISWPISGAMELGLRNLKNSLHRSTVAVAAAMTAFAMMLGTSVMIDSFRSTVDYWVGQTVRADIYLTPAANLSHGANEALPLKMMREVSQLRGVSDVDTYREIWMDSPFPKKRGGVGKIKVSAIDFDVLHRHHHLVFVGGDMPDFSAMRRVNRMLVNESFAHHYGKQVGDMVPLRTPSGKIEFRIAGIFVDYSTDGGLLLLDHSRYAELWKDPRTYSMALYLDGTRHSQAVLKEIRERYGKETRLAIFSNQDLRAEVLRVFDQTFAMTLALRGVAVAVAALGVFLTLGALIAERSREMAIIRALGMSPGGVMRMALTEASLMGGLGWAMGCVGGLGVSWLLAFVINKAYFGWTIQWRLDPSLFLSAFLLALPAALLAGFLSVTHILKRPMVEALRYE